MQGWFERALFLVFGRVERSRNARRTLIMMNERESANLARFTVNRSGLQLAIHACRTARIQ